MFTNPMDKESKSHHSFIKLRYTIVLLSIIEYSTQLPFYNLSYTGIRPKRTLQQTRHAQLLLHTPTPIHRRHDPTVTYDRRTHHKVPVRALQPVPTHHRLPSVPHAPRPPVHLRRDLLLRLADRALPRRLAEPPFSPGEVDRPGGDVAARGFFGGGGGGAVSS